MLHELEKQGIYIGNGYFIMMMLTLYPLSAEILDNQSNQMDQLQQIIETVLNNRELLFSTVSMIC